MDFIPPALCSTTERTEIRARGPKFVPRETQLYSATATTNRGRSSMKPSRHGIPLTF
jgi:hypothetical protein